VIIGTDTSHVIAFARVLNDDSSPDHVPHRALHSPYKGVSADLDSSARAWNKFPEELRTKWNVASLTTSPP